MIPVAYHLFHVSPKRNDNSIAKEGVNPSYHIGGYASSWFVDKPMLNWALAHCSLRHKIAVSDLRVWVAVIPSDKLVRIRWGLVYRVNEIILPAYLGQWDDTELEAWLRR